MVALALAMIALFARVMTYPLQHDEQFYVSAGVLFTADGLYPRLGFSHLPNLPILLHLLYALPISAHYLLAARLVTFAAWCGGVAAVLIVGRRLAGGGLAVALLVALLLTNPILLGPTGMATTNNFISIPFALFGLLAFLEGLTTARPRPGMFILSGVLLALAAGFKINYAVLALPFAVAAFLVPASLSLGERIRSVVLPLLIGGIVGFLPTLFFLAQDPQGLLTHVVAFHRGPQIAYWLAHPDPADPKIMDPRGKVLLAEQLWLSGGTMVLVMTLGVLAALAIAQALASRGPARTLGSFGWRIWLIGATTILACAVSFLPTPAFPQYFTLPIPFALALLAALHGQLDQSRREAARPFLIVGMVVAILGGAPMLLSASPTGLMPHKWTGLQVHADALRIAGLVRTSRSQAPVVTLEPLYVLEGGGTVYPQLGLGPFVYRAADYIPPRERRYFSDPVSPTTIGALLRATCPAAALIGSEGQLDVPLAAFAHERNYLPQPITLHAAEQKTALLMVRPSAAGRCDQAPRPPAGPSLH